MLMQGSPAVEALKQDGGLDGMGELLLPPTAGRCFSPRHRQRGAASPSDTGARFLPPAPGRVFSPNTGVGALFLPPIPAAGRFPPPPNTDGGMLFLPLIPTMGHCLLPLGTVQPSLKSKQSKLAFCLERPPD